MQARSVFAPELLADVVRRIRLVPDADRVFTHTTADALRMHRISPDLLDRLLDLGLPHRGTGADRRFDELDLANAGLDLGLPSARRMAMRWWSKSLATIVPGTVSRFSLHVAVACPEPGHAGTCRFTVHPGFAGAVDRGTLRPRAPGALTCDVTLPCVEHHFGAILGPLVEHATALRFHLLPHRGVGTDLGFLAATGLADCRLATMSLVRAGRRAGIAVRPALGYFVAPPYAQEHTWIEVRDGGEWWPADPFLLHALAVWGITDSVRWPPHRSPHGLLWRLGERPVPGVTHGGAATNVNVAIVGRAAVGPAPTAGGNR